MEHITCNNADTSGNFMRISDGNYLWLHTTNLYKSPVFLFLIWKIYFSIYIFVAAYIIGIVAANGGMVGALFNMALPLFGTLCFLFFLTTFSYYLYALIMGGQYVVLFKMDKKGVRHIHLNNKFCKTNMLCGISAFLSVATGNPTALGAVALASGNSVMYTKFSKVNAVRANRKKGVIKIRSETVMFNQIYTAPENFSEVLDFISQHIKIKKRGEIHEAQT